jgi:hypothetical protein
VTDEQMLKQCMSASVCVAGQLSVFFKGNVSISANPFGLSKRRERVSPEPIVFFAHPFPLWQVMTNVRARAAWRNDTVVPFGRFVSIRSSICLP